MKPFRPGKPVKPFRPGKPVKPFRPGKPVKPFGPAKPVKPKDPSQIIPSRPIYNTTKPTKPTKPVKPSWHFPWWHRKKPTQVTADAKPAQKKPTQKKPAQKKPAQKKPGQKKPRKNPSKIAKTALKYAKSRLGDPYSQAKAGIGRYVDCSKLTQLSYKKAGINIPRTAAEQARWCDTHKKTIARGYNQRKLRPGDLIFFALKSNGRYKNIGHAAMYAGRGKYIEASYSRHKVVMRNAWGKSSIKVVCRPYK